jgi:hypothetical protein
MRCLWVGVDVRSEGVIMLFGASQCIDTRGCMGSGLVRGWQSATGACMAGRELAGSRTWRL